MSDVERFEFTIYGDASGGMEPCVDGRYIRYDDYNDLASRLEAALAEVRQLRIWHDDKSMRLAETREMLGRAESRLDALTKAAVRVANDLKEASKWRAQLYLTSEGADLLAEQLRSALVVEIGATKTKCDHILRDTSEPGERRFIGHRCILEAGHDCDHVWSRD